MGMLIARRRRLNAEAQKKSAKVAKEPKVESEVKPAPKQAKK